jgi:hypothetical protein
MGSLPGDRTKISGVEQLLSANDGSREKGCGSTKRLQHALQEVREAMQQKVRQCYMLQIAACK